MFDMTPKLPPELLWTPEDEEPFEDEPYQPPEDELPPPPPARDIVAVLLGRRSPAEEELALQRAFGTDDKEVVAELVRTARSAFGSDEVALEAFTAGLNELQPRDHLERLLVCQMLLVSHKATTALAEAAGAADERFRELHERRAVRFIRLFMQQMLALKKYRRNAQQTINVVYSDKTLITGPVQGGGQK